jgi:hypothetical protein
VRVGLACAQVRFVRVGLTCAQVRTGIAVASLLSTIQPPRRRRLLLMSSAVFCHSCGPHWQSPCGIAGSTRASLASYPIRRSTPSKSSPNLSASRAGWERNAACADCWSGGLRNAAGLSRPSSTARAGWNLAARSGASRPNSVASERRLSESSDPAHGPARAVNAWVAHAPSQLEAPVSALAWAGIHSLALRADEMPASPRVQSERKPLQASRHRSSSWPSDEAPHPYNPGSVGLNPLAGPGLSMYPGPLGARLSLTKSP